MGCAMAAGTGAASPAVRSRDAHLRPATCFRSDTSILLPSRRNDDADGTIVLLSGSDSAYAVGGAATATSSYI